MEMFYGSVLWESLLKCLVEVLSVYQVYPLIVEVFVKDFCGSVL